MLCGSLGGRGLWGRRDTCICVAESLAVHLKLSQLCQLATPQYKIQSLEKISYSIAHRTTLNVL